MNRVLPALLILALSQTAYAEGACPPGSYPIGGQCVQGCAPIPGGGGAGSSERRMVADGEWQTRWGAVSEDTESMSTGASVSMKSKRLAVAAADAECKRLGGKSCKLRLAYFNQCIAIADPDSSQLANGGGKSMVVSAETVEQAKEAALSKCQVMEIGQTCEIVYSACSMSEYKSYR